MIPNRQQEDALSSHLIHLFRHAKHARLFLAGENIFQQGEPGDEMYVITDGEVAIVRDGTCIAIRGPGELIGEIAVLDAQPRYATATAHTMCTLSARLREQRSVSDTGYRAMSLESMYGW